MEFSCHFEGVDSFNFDADSLSASLILLVEDFGFVPGDISLVFCSDEYILEANRTYLQHDYFTDIITFDYSEGTVVSGDLLISIDTVLSNSVLYNVDFKEELFRVVIHGLLHLCGLGDKEEEEIALMRSKENQYLGALKNPF